MKIIEAIVEMPMGTSYKYEIDKSTDKIVLDRVLNQKVPYNYGYVPNTLFSDGDPLDIFIISWMPIPTGIKVKVKVFDVLPAEDNGERDDKLVGILVGEEDFFEYRTHGLVNLIESYLLSYKPGFKLLDKSKSIPIDEILKTSENNYILNKL